MLEYPRFRGNWNTLWVAGRYGYEFLTGVTTRKLANATLAMAEMQLARPRPRSFPFVVRLEPTGVCDLRCPRCATGLGIDPRPKGFLSLESLDRVIDLVRPYGIRELARTGVIAMQRGSEDGRPATRETETA